MGKKLALPEIRSRQALTAPQARLFNAGNSAIPTPALCTGPLAIASGHGSQSVLAVAAAPSAMKARAYNATSARAAAARDDAFTSGGRMAEEKGRSAET